MGTAKTYHAEREPTGTNVRGRQKLHSNDLTPGARNPDASHRQWRRSLRATAVIDAFVSVHRELIARQARYRFGHSFCAYRERLWRQDEGKPLARLEPDAAELMWNTSRKSGVSSV
jgi:hypothetical protein